MNKSLFSALGLEKMAISLTIGLIVMVAALNIVASLILLVMEKHRDIAHPEDDGRERAERDDDLHDAGADHRRHRHDGRRRRPATGCRTLMTVTSSFACPRRLPDVVCPVPRAAARYRSSWSLGAVLICFFATIYPSRQAAKLDPVQALRYE